MLFHKNLIIKRGVSFVLLIGIFLLANVAVALASTTSGTVDSTYKYGWSENIGWINFGCDNCNVNITDSGMTGYGWNASHGWINLNPTTSGIDNNEEGTLSGSAWGKNTGWINFSGVTIDSDGYFNGYANGTITGQINFNCANTSSCGSSDFKVRTDWRPQSSRPACNNSIDDDGDGLTDYPNDPGCTSDTDIDETDPATEEEPEPVHPGGGREYDYFYTTTITSNGSNYEIDISVNEGIVFVTTVKAKAVAGTIEYEIYGGDDESLFSIDIESGVLEFKFAPDYEHPQDKDGDNKYEIFVKAYNTKYSKEDQQKIFVTIIKEEGEHHLFDDTIDHWAELYIEKIVQAGIAQGVSENLFEPNREINRAEATKMSAIAFEYNIAETVDQSSFPDVDVSKWYATYIEAAKDKDIISGYADGFFRPENPINRVEALKILLEAYLSKDEVNEIEITSLPFKDVDILSWYAPYICYAYNTGLVDGYSPEQFEPEKNITRAEFSKIIVELLGL